MNVDFQGRHVVSNFYLHMASCTLLSAAVKRQVQMKVIVIVPAPELILVILQVDG